MTHVVMSVLGQSVVSSPSRSKFQLDSTRSVPQQGKCCKSTFSRYCSLIKASILYSYWCSDIFLSLSISVPNSFFIIIDARYWQAVSLYSHTELQVLISDGEVNPIFEYPGMNRHVIIRCYVDTII